MFVVRPVETRDISALVSLGANARLGVHTLPRTVQAVEHAVQRSLASFAAHVDIPSEEAYFFVLESADDRSIVGAAAISAMAGAGGIFFAFRNDVIQQVSRDLDMSHSVHVLTLCSNLTGCSQLSGFYVHERCRAGRQAELLSRARLLFAASAPQRFRDRFFASLSGMVDVNGRSPFWEALGRKFFNMDFLEAERVIEGTRDRALIVEMMPHYPVYVPLLPGEAQTAMGQAHGEGELPFRILSQEGFESDEFIDIFDGGAILQAHRSSLRSFSASTTHRLAAAASAAVRDASPLPYLVSNTREERFRAVVADLAPLERTDELSLPSEVLRALDVVAGDSVSCVKL